MKAPKKIYLQVCGDCEENECQSCKFEDLEDNVTWSRDPIFKKDVEYTRTDAFIEKACKAFCKVCKMPNCNSKDCSYLKDFRNHMKGE